MFYLKTSYIKGPEVHRVQEALNRKGFRNSADGIYGPFTQALIKKFQANRQLKADGVVGPTTLAALAEVG